MVAGRTRSQGADTRTRILAAAVELFAERGYAGTSVRDIAERLGVTKAALYYHFSSKEMILDALISPFESGLAQLAESARREPPPQPRVLLEALVSLLVEAGSVLCAFANDPSVLHHRIGKEDLRARFETLIRGLAGPRPTAARIIRARCAIGCVQVGVMGSAMDRLRGGGLSACGGSSDLSPPAEGGLAAVAARYPAPSVAVVETASRSLGAGPGRGAGEPATRSTTTAVGSPSGIHPRTGLTGAGGADGPADAGEPGITPGASVAEGDEASCDALLARPAVGDDAGPAGTGASAGVGGLSLFSPLLPEELQRLIVEAALAALGPDQSMEP